jgi:hypothetical protein
MIRIDGMTERQVNLLDEIWSLDTAEEFLHWLYSQPAHVQHEAVVLQELLTLEVLDSELDRTDRFPLAEQMIANIMERG